MHQRSHRTPLCSIIHHKQALNGFKYLDDSILVFPY